MEKIGLRRKRYPLKIKAKAVELVKSGEKAAHVAADCGVPVQTLANWINADRKGSLGGLVRLSIEEMENIIYYCSTMLDNDLMLREMSEELKLLAKLKKKIVRAINIARKAPGTSN